MRWGFAALDPSHSPISEGVTTVMRRSIRKDRLRADILISSFTQADGDPAH